MNLITELTKFTWNAILFQGRFNSWSNLLQVLFWRKQVKKIKTQNQEQTVQKEKNRKIETLPLYWGKRVEKELTSSIPDSFQEGSNFSMVQRSMLGSSSQGFGLSCFPLCFFGFCDMSPLLLLFSCSSIPTFIFCDRKGKEFIT